MLYVLEYGAGNVRSLANSLTKLGFEFEWVREPSDFEKATKLVFPGVGAFRSAVDTLRQRGLLEPLRQYIASGRPYFGICIGMQILYSASDENPGVEGLGLIPSTIQRFADDDKTVPHIGWNEADGNYYYFVHSYRAAYDHECNPEAATWMHSTTQYGQEVFVSSVRKANLFATQYHPEKSGEVGLQVLRTWLKSDSVNVSAAPAAPISRPPNASHALTKRIVACLDVRSNDSGDLIVTKGDQYDVRERAENRAVRNLGKPVALCKHYYDAGADELCLLNITSFRHSPLKDQPMLDVVRAAANEVFVPLCIGGGIKDTVDPDGTPHSALEVASLYFEAGADKVSIGSEAVYIVEQMLADGGCIPPGNAISSIAEVYGNQAVVVSIDPRRCFVEESHVGPYAHEVVKKDGTAWWYQCTVSGGRESRQLSVLQLARGVQTLGAGELLVNSIDRDGTGLGFDLDLLNLVRNAVQIPVIASSGAGSARHFEEVFIETKVEAALAAGIFHREEVKVSDVKHALRARHLPVRSM